MLRLTRLSLSLQAFVQHYYAAFDAEASRPGLAALYQPTSMLTFEGSKLQARPRRVCDCSKRRRLTRRHRAATP